MPTSEDSFIGKEHFWMISDQLNLPRYKGNKLFVELCFPFKNGEPVKQNRVGIKVTTRQAISFPHPDTRVMAYADSHATIRQGKYAVLFGRAYRKSYINSNSALIQVGSIFDIHNDQERQKLLLSNYCIELLPRYAEVLEEIVKP